MKLNDRIIVNLKILTNIPENSKIVVTHNGIIKFFPVNYFTSVMRFFYRESRSKSIVDITNIIESTFEICDNIMNSKYFTKGIAKNIEDSFVIEKLNDEYSKQYSTLVSISDELKKLPESLRTLKSTYANDRPMIAKIDVIINRIERYLVVINKHII